MTDSWRTALARELGRTLGPHRITDRELLMNVVEPAFDWANDHEFEHGVSDEVFAGWSVDEFALLRPVRQGRGHVWSDSSDSSGVIKSG